jgi:hypothetical protein
MKSLNTLYHMARADILERTRRYSFLIVLGLVVWLGYLVASGVFALRVTPNFTGEINSPWVGALMTVTVNMFLGWFGFYVVKGSVARDYDTGVGQIMATTPLNRVQYMLGKWLSNLAVLSIMLLILLVVGAVMVLFSGAPLEPWKLASPLLILGIPCMALVAALAVLFDTIRWLRGGLGNIIYFFAFILVLIPIFEIDRYIPLLDFTGFRLIGDHIVRAANVVYPGSGTSYGYAYIENPTEMEFFTFDGLPWTMETLGPRLALLAIAIGIVLLAAVFFDRFNTYPPPPRRKKERQPAGVATAGAEAIPLNQVQLTPLAVQRPSFRFGALYVAELKLLLKGLPWWWYGVAGGLVIAQFFNELEITRILLLVTWVWPVLVLSGFGTREARHHTGQIVFAAPRPVLYQLPARWLAAFSVMALLGSGALLKYLTLGLTPSLLAWLAGAVFIPSLALSLGVLTASSKAFEVVYVVWMYLISQDVAALDFVGMSAKSPWYVYLPLGLALLAIAAAARRWQIRTGRVNA